MKNISFINDYHKYINSTNSLKEEVIEKALIYFLTNELGYIYRNDINDINDLKSNFKFHFESLNNHKIPDIEFDKWWIEFNSGDVFKRFTTLKSNWYTAKDKSGKIEKTFKYFDTENIENNRFEVVNQLWTKNKYGEKNRFDILILINGIPIVHIELKNEKHSFKEAQTQINRYKDIEAIFDFLRFTKLFVVSNGTKTRYFANNNSLSLNNYIYSWTNEKNENFDGESGMLKFAKSFFDKSFLIDFVENYFVVDNNQNRGKLIKVFRPYQYHATNNIIKKIKDDTLTNKQKSGYVWHATGSGKTLTAFKTCEILSKKCKHVDLTIFLIDRNDLNLQTLENFKNFTDDATSIQNATDTNDLINLLNNPNSNRRIIITTIQKLNNALRTTRKQKLINIANKKVVFVVDEGHRSQIGEMRKNIESFFTNSINVAFTGTPIFTTNSIDGKTTENIFGSEIHRYNTYNAIKDKNVLPFTFIETVSINKEKDLTSTDYDDEFNEILSKYDNAKVIDVGKIQGNIDYIYDNYNKLTLNKKFNAILATSSIEEAIKYYQIIKDDNILRPAIVYSINKSDNSKNAIISQKAYEFLRDRMHEINETWDDAKFDTYKSTIQKDFSDEKNRKYDLLIVVSMLLTGFDSPITNTIFLDKHLRYQSLIQAISRTNRLHIVEKECGNIVSFKTSREDLDESLILYTNGEESNKLNKVISEIVFSYESLKNEFNYVIDKLLTDFPNIDVVAQIDMNDKQKCENFINAFENVLKIFNKIKPIPEFKWQDFKLDKRTFEQYNEHWKEIVQKSGLNIPIYVHSDYETIDLEIVKIDTNYLNKLIKNILELKFKNVNENVKESEFYKKTKEMILKDCRDDEIANYLIDFFSRNETYVINDFKTLLKMWNDYMRNKIEFLKDNAAKNWNTSMDTINILIQSINIKKELDKDFIEEKLSNFIDNPLGDEQKFEEVNIVIRKIHNLKSLFSFQNEYQ